MALQKIELDKVKELAEKAHVKPAVVKGKEILRFMKKESPNLEEISWERFEEIRKKAKVAVYANGTWMKILKEK